MDVKKLPTDVQSLLSASAIVNNYKRAIEELVYNSLDAECTCIAIRIHIQNNWMQVVDNGIGIKKADFKLLGERYATSKLLDINTLKAVPSKYGYQGQALSNIIKVSETVRITSRHADIDDTWVKTFVRGKTHKECSKAPMRHSKGTTIEIHGFLYNLKIQKKCINAFNELQDIKMFLEQLSLVFNNVSISLRDDSENEIIFKMHKNRDTYQTLKTLFDIQSNDVQELRVEKNEYKVYAFIGDEKKGLKNVQWIYLNNKFINISNLHRIINKKFSKSSRMNQKKIKARKPYECNEEKSVACDFVPFYILFLICPYYEYDIISSGKHTNIQFKDWMQINNLIEKLVKFYNDDLQLINIQKNENQKAISNKVEDTRHKVKKIMEKILGRRNKIVEVPQLQNGIRGKRVRRKRKKQHVNISLKKVIPPKRNTCVHKTYENKENSDDGNIGKNETAIKTALSPGGSDILPKPMKKYSKSKNKRNKRSSKISKTDFKCSCHKKHYNVIELFKNGSRSMNRRCRELSYAVKDFLNINKSNKSKNILSITQMKNKSPVIDRTQSKHIINESELHMNTKSPDIVETKRLQNKQQRIEKLTSYDLLQTVLNTQQSFHEKSSKEVAFRTTNKSNAEQRSHAQTMSYYCAPKLTFESHKYINSSVIQKTLRQPKFLNKQSKYNLNIGADKAEPNIQIKATKRHNLISAINNRLLNTYKQNGLEMPFSIDKSGTDIVEFSKQIRNQVMNDMNSMIDTRDCDKINNIKSLSNIQINFNIERTYTILMDSFYNALQQFNDPKNHKTLMDDAVDNTNFNHHDIISSDHTYKTSGVIFTSEVRDPCAINIDEPLEICEAVLSSPKDNELDFNYSFITMSQLDSSLIINESKNMSKLLSHINQSLNMNSSNNKRFSHKRIIQKTKPKVLNGSMKANKHAIPDKITYKKVKYSKNETDTIQENSLYNFKLNTRYRFVPKGMSQIFKNNNSKNICSYNLDKEYYENTIYNNFVEDVAVNCEILEPAVQNIKEFTTGGIQKVTEKIKKHNADLIFGTDSLRSAKVLGQVDCKFIAAIIQGASQTHTSPEFLVFFDQHAVHERIRLEKNLSDYFTDNNWKKVGIDTISLKSSRDEILYLHNHKDKFARFGLEWTILNNAEILVNAIPEAIKGKHSRSIEIIAKTVKDLILEQTHAIKYLKGNISLYPQSIMNLVFSEACRYAVKFGDKLSLRDCVQLIADLADCKTPFQCAHGRPVMAVMVELMNEKFKYKINMENIKQFKTRMKL